LSALPDELAAQETATPQSQSQIQFTLAESGMAASGAAPQTDSGTEEKRTAVEPGNAEQVSGGLNESPQTAYEHAAFADAVAIYLLSLTIDFDYAELREREYPLLAPPALAERLRCVANLYPPSEGYEFAIRYRRRA
jgi:hypothetical protein